MHTCSCGLTAAAKPQLCRSLPADPCRAHDALCAPHTPPDSTEDHHIDTTPSFCPPHPPTTTPHPHHHHQGKRVGGRQHTYSTQLTMLTPHLLSALTLCRANAWEAASAVSRPVPARLTTRLLLDCMGHYSPIVKQLRGRAQPEGVVLVAGGCAQGVPAEANTSADLLYTFTDASDGLQLFWEAFPAGGQQGGPDAACTSSLVLPGHTHACSWWQVLWRPVCSLGQAAGRVRWASSTTALCREAVPTQEHTRPGQCHVLLAARLAACLIHLRCG
jgi:hypothetical protein